MPGRIPKAKAQRARANKTMGEQLPRDGGARVTPPLPGRNELCSYAQDYWEVIWSSPMSLVYLDADIPALVRLTELVHLWHVGRETSILGEIRQVEDRYGLSPLSRRRLEWEITAAGGKLEEPDVPTGEDDRWLRVVS